MLRTLLTFFHSPWRRFLSFAFLLALPLGAGESYVRSLPNPSKSKHAYLSTHGHAIDWLVLGSSHTYYGLAPELLSPRAYSAAQVSQTLRYDEWVVKHYALPRLHTMILPISDFSLYEELEDGREWYLANRYRLYMDCSIHPRGSVYDWECTAFRVFCEKLKSLWQKPNMRWSQYGQGLEYTVANKAQDWDNGEERAATNRYDRFEQAETNLRYLEGIAQHCAQRRIRLVLLATPLRPSYRAHQHPAQVADTERHLQLFFNRHPQVLYFDFRADTRFGANDFYDSDHLSLQGSHKLTRLLADTLQAKR